MNRNKSTYVKPALAAYEYRLETIVAATNSGSTTSSITLYDDKDGSDVLSNRKAWDADDWASSEPTSE